MVCAFVDELDLFRLLRIATKFWWMVQFFMLNPMVCFFFREMKNKKVTALKGYFFYLFVKESMLFVFSSSFSCFIILGRETLLD